MILINLSLVGFNQLLLISMLIFPKVKCKLEISLISFFNKEYFSDDFIFGNLLNNFFIILKSCDVRS